jgi:hypothetical protein
MGDCTAVVARQPPANNKREKVFLVRSVPRYYKQDNWNVVSLPPEVGVPHRLKLTVRAKCIPKRSAGFIFNGINREDSCP